MECVVVIKTFSQMTLRKTFLEVRKEKADKVVSEILGAGSEHC